MNTGESKEQPGFWRKFFLKKWHPIPTVNSTILLFVTVGLIFMVLAILITIFNANITEVKVGDYGYNTNCVDQLNTGTPCQISFSIASTIKAPIQVFQELDNFYQNHRRYIKSKDSSQLSGSVISVSEAILNCDPIVLNSDLGPPYIQAWDNVTLLNPSQVASPCGLIARSIFNDTQQLQSGSTQITIDQTGIAWPNDIGNKFKQGPNSNQTQWINPENEHFVVWMRTAGLPDFRKLWGTIRQDLQPGVQTLYVNNNYNVQTFNGHKSFILSTSGPFGGKNIFLEVAFYVVAGILLLIALIFFIKKKMTGGKFGEKKDN